MLTRLAMAGLIATTLTFISPTQPASACRAIPGTSGVSHCDKIEKRKPRKKKRGHGAAVMAPLR